MGSLLPKNSARKPPKGAKRLENYYPKRMSGLGIEGWEEKKEMMVWA